MKDSFVDSWNKDIVNGNAKSRAHWVGNVVVQVGLSFLGTKGADKVRAFKLSKMSKVPNVLKAKRKGKITKAFNAVHPKLQSVFNVLSPAYIRKVVENDMLRAAKTGMRKTLDAIGKIGFKVYTVTPEGQKIPMRVTVKDLFQKINMRGVAKSTSKISPEEIRKIDDNFLDRMESSGGHTLERHISKTNEELIKRAIKEDVDATTYTDKSTAIKAIQENLRKNAESIADWLNESVAKRKVFDISHNHGIGKGVLEDKKQVIYNLTHSRVVLIKDSSQELGFKILTWIVNTKLDNFFKVFKFEFSRT